MKKYLVVSALILCSYGAWAQSELNGNNVWFGAGLGLGGPDRAGFLIESDFFYQYMADPLSLVAAVDVDWRLIDGIAVPLQVGAGWRLFKAYPYYHHIFALAGWDFVTGQACAEINYRIFGPLSSYITLGWDRGPRLLAGFCFGWLFR